MPISAPGRTEAGLTLVELLVVLLIVGMTAGIVMLSAPRPETSLLSASRQFERDVVSARDQAIAEAALYGIEPLPGGYAVYRLVSEGWLLLESRSLPGELSFELAPGDAFELPEHREEIAFGLPTEEEAPTAALMPDILFAADGSATPFTASFTGGDGTIEVACSQFGQIVEDRP